MSRKVVSHRHFRRQIFQTPYASGNRTIHWEYVLVGELNGRLTGAEGRITSTESMIYPNVNTGCTETFETASGSYTRGFRTQLPVTHNWYD